MNRPLPQIPMTSEPTKMEELSAEELERKLIQIEGRLDTGFSFQTKTQEDAEFLLSLVRKLRQK